MLSSDTPISAKHASLADVEYSPFYLGDGYERSVARIFSSCLFLAHALSKVVAEQYTQWKLLYIMLSELSGTLEQIFDDKADLHLQTLENLEMAAERFKTFLDSIFASSFLPLKV
jgi:hypothetical protein